MSRNKHNKTLGSIIERTDDRIDETGEVFTPLSLCLEMVNQIPLEELQNPNSTFLDASAGNGNFLVALKSVLLNYHSEEYILNHMLYGVELMKDNHQEMCERLGVPITHKHFQCADALQYDYSFGEPHGLECYMM